MSVSHHLWMPCGRAAMLAECDAPCERAARPFVLAATILASAMVFIDSMVVNVALPAIQSEYHADFGVLQWVVNAYALILGALILTGGALGDRHGRRRIFLTGIGLFAVGSVACALAPSSSWLIGARAAQGLGGALLVPQSLAIIAASFPKNVRGRAIGIWAAASALAAACGLIVGGLLIDLLSWRAAFWINVPLTLVAAALTMRFVPESRAAVRGAMDWIGGVLATTGLALVIYAMTRLTGQITGRGQSIAILMVGTAVLIGFVVHESQAEAPLMPLSIFRSLVFNAANAITLGLYFSLSVAFFLLPYTLIQVHGYSGLEVGAALIPVELVMALLSRPASRLSDRWGLRATLASGTGLLALACTGFAVAEQPGAIGYWSVYLPAILVLAAGMAISVAPLATAVLGSVLDDESGVASGVNNAISRIASVVAVAVAGLLSLASFPHYLADRMTAADVGPELQSALLAGTSRLAALQAPAHVAGATSRLLHAMILEAYVASYRTGMLAAAAMAAIAMGVALLYLPGRTATQRVG